MQWGANLDRSGDGEQFLFAGSRGRAGRAATTADRAADKGAEGQVQVQRRRGILIVLCEARDAEQESQETQFPLTGASEHPTWAAITGS